ncbi:MAG: hypothetical protein LBM08_00755 [Dysgonamonadaceae bacterium]|jgi:hypothetical protein|nr:hypothetical protein [Dysgonamonadaceae bacterium]
MKQYEILDPKIKNLTWGGPLVSMYLCAGIKVLKEKIDTMSEEEIAEMFPQLLHPDRIRCNINEIYKKIKSWDK